MDLVSKYVQELLNKSTPEMPLWNLEKIRQGKTNVWNYIDGCMMIGLLELHRITGEKKYWDFVENYIDYYVHEDGAILGFEEAKYNLDDVCEGQVLFDLYKDTGKERYRKAADTLYGQLLRQPRTEEGSFWHKLIYPNQVWLDGLFMAQVFYTRYTTAFDECRGYEDIKNQFLTVRKRMYDPSTGLYRHGYDASHKAFWCEENGCSKSVWLRSLGWFSLALIMVMGYEDPDSHELKDALAPIARELAASLENYIDPISHMLYQVPDQREREGNYPETSGSAMISCFYMKGARLGILDAKYAEIGKQIYEGICERYLSERDGELNLGGICLVAGLGPEDNRRRDGSYEYYMSEPVVENDAKGLGPFLLSYTEVLRLAKKEGE